MKKVLAMVLVVVTLVSSMCFSASAQTGFWLAQNRYDYNNNRCCVCTLSKPGKKDAKVTVRLTTTNCSLTVKMTDNRGRHIWSEDYSMGVNAKKKYRRERTYTLGKNHSVYNLYFKATNGKGYGFCSVSNPKNCKIV